jgi:hypothetical protein
MLLRIRCANQFCENSILCPIRKLPLGGCMHTEIGDEGVTVTVVPLPLVLLLHRSTDYTSTTLKSHEVTKRLVASPARDEP